MMRVRVIGDGWSGGPSLNTFYFTDIGDFVESAQAAVDRVRSGFTAKDNLWPGFVTHRVDSAVDVVNPATGDVTDTLNVNPGATIDHSGSSGLMAAPSTAYLVSLTTDTFIGGRRLRGRWFISPTTQGASDGDGTLTTGALASLTQLGNDIRVSAGLLPNLVVWHRPVGGVGGATGIVTATVAREKFAVLRSRRD